MGDRSGLVESGGADIGALPLPAEGAVRIASFNIENLGGGASASLVRLGRQTGAGYMLYGDLLSEGGRYRLAMSLMDLKSGELLWNASRSAAR